MIVVVDHAAREKCPLCTSSLEKPGYVLQDSEGVRRFLCWPHVQKLLAASLWPVQTIMVES
jgi:hypothetical protein